jgi:ubiquinone/menaquinone biosynthesis C-methylase UbiE
MHYVQSRGQLMVGGSGENEVPTCLKGLIASRIPDPFRGGVEETQMDFIEANVAKPIRELQPDYFDLAYCKKVLYHVWCEQGEPAAQSAVNEMARVVRPGGWVVAVEPVSSSPTDGVALDFRQFFERAGLMQITEVDAKTDSSACLCPYLYEKPQHVADVEEKGLQFWSGEEQSA